MFSVRYSVPHRLLLQRVIDRVKGTPGGLATLDEEGNVEQVVENFPRNEANGIAGLDVDGKLLLSVLPVDIPGGLLALDGAGKVPDNRLPASVAKLDANGQVPVSLLPTNVPGGVLLLDGTGRIPDAHIPAALVRLDGSGKVPSAALPLDVPGGIPALDGSGKLQASQLPNTVVRVDGTGKIPLESLPPIAPAFDPFTSFVSNNYYEMARIRPVIASDAILLVDGHGRQLPGTGAMTSAPVTRTANTSFVTIAGTGGPLLVAGRTGFAHVIGGSKVFDQVTINATYPLTIAWEVAPGSGVDTRYFFGLATGAAYDHTGTAATAQDFSGFRYSATDADTTWRIVHTQNDTNDNVSLVVNLDSAVPFVTDAFVKFELRVKSATVLEYYINDALVLTQNNFYYGAPKNVSTLLTRKVLRTLTSQVKLSTTDPSFKLKSYSVKVYGDELARFFLQG